MDDAVVDERGLEPGQFLHGGPPPHALVGGSPRVSSTNDRDDLVVEGAGVLCRGGPFVGQRGVLVELGAGESPLLRDHLRAESPWLNEKSS